MAVPEAMQGYVMKKCLITSRIPFSRLYISVLKPRLQNASIKKARKGFFVASLDAVIRRSSFRFITRCRGTPIGIERVLAESCKAFLPSFIE